MEKDVFMVIIEREVNNMPKLSLEQLKVIPLKELQEVVYELGFDEAYEIDDRDALIDYYLDWS